MSSDTDRGYTIINPDDVADSYADSDVPGEFRRLTDALDGDQLAVTLIRVPAHCDFEQGTGHHHTQTRPGHVRREIEVAGQDKGDRSIADARASRRH
jgi:hypothetical protein